MTANTDAKRLLLLLSTPARLDNITRFPLATFSWRQNEPVTSGRDIGGRAPADLDLQYGTHRGRGGPEINRGDGSLSRSIHPSPRSYSDGGQLTDRGLSGLGLRWKSGRVMAPEPSPFAS